MRTLTLCAAAFILSLALVGCKSSPSGSDAGGGTMGGISTGAPAPDAATGPNGATKSGNMLSTHSDPAPAGVETGNYAGGKK